MSKSMALEVASRNITINCVAPGFIETEMTKDILDKMRKVLKKVFLWEELVRLMKLQA